MKLIGIVFLVTLTVVGCARVDARRDFADVGQAVRDRTGQNVQWRSGSAEDAQADAAVRDLLSRELDAEAAVQVALLNNRNLQASYEQLGIAQASLVRAGLLRNPIFDVDAKFLEGGGGTIVEMAFLQNLGDVLTMSLRKRLATSQVQESKARVTGDVISLAAEVRRAFVELQAAQQMRELRQTTLAATDAAVTLARSMRDAGNITALDLASQQAMWEQAKLDLADAERRIFTGRERLNAVMGLWGRDAMEWQLAARLPDPPADEPKLDRLERDAIEKSVTLACSKQQLDRAFQSLRPAQRNALLRGLEAGVAAERDPGSPWAFGPAVSVPVPLFDQSQAAVSIAGSEFRAARERYAAQAVEIRAAARAAAVELRSALDRARYQRSVILPLREQIVNETQQHYNAMQIGAFQLLQAKQQQIDGGARYVELLRDYWLARAAVDRIAAGGASAETATSPIALSLTASNSQGGH
jgi:cobalt-zinc-cadmium efflux system outer membrane protein